MVVMVPDKTGRFLERPHYNPRELDDECEEIICSFLRNQYGQVRFPVKTDDLTKLIEQKGAVLDTYADLDPDVEGVTEFHSNRKIVVRISRHLSNDARQENRLRTTLTHEYGHVHFHAYLWASQGRSLDLFSESKEIKPVSRCKRENIYAAPKTDWMEWQAGYVCGALLMPREYLAKLVRSYLEENGLYPPNISGEHAQAMIEKVAKEFQVSKQAARVRLEKLDYLGNHGLALSLPEQV